MHLTPAQFAKLQGKGRTTKPDDLNGLERAYLAHLETLRLAGEIAGYWPHAIKLRLADRTWYTPDFLVMLPDGALELHECKGFMRDDAAVKLKVAAETFWQFTFRLVKKTRAGWSVKVV